MNNINIGDIYQTTSVSHAGFPHFFKVKKITKSFVHFDKLKAIMAPAKKCYFFAPGRIVELLENEPQPKARLGGDSLRLTGRKWCWPLTKYQHLFRGHDD